MKLKNAAELSEVLEDFAGETVAVRTEINDLYLVFETEDWGACYQGVPFAEDEDSVKVNRNSGSIGDLSPLAWPLTLLSPYERRHRDWREKRLAFERSRDEKAARR